jgi:hypothetical protein
LDDVASNDKKSVSSFKLQGMLSRWAALFAIWMIANCSLAIEVALTGAAITLVFSCIFTSTSDVWNELRWTPERLVSLEARSGWNLRFDHLLIDADPRRHLATATPPLFFTGNQRLSAFVHAARFDAGAALQTLQAGDLFALLANNLLQRALVQFSGLSILSPSDELKAVRYDGRVAEFGRIVRGAPF